MSGPYDSYNQYNQQYPPQQQGQYGQYPPQQSVYEQGGYQQPGYAQQQPPASQAYYGGAPQDQSQQYGAYGAPATGGFQHGQQVAPYDHQHQQG
jgi:hypothetical protein